MRRVLILCVALMILSELATFLTTVTITEWRAHENRTRLHPTSVYIPRYEPAASFAGVYGACLYPSIEYLEGPSQFDSWGDYPGKINWSKGGEYRLVRATCDAEQRRINNRQPTIVRIPKRTAKCEVSGETRSIRILWMLIEQDSVWMNCSGRIGNLWVGSRSSGGLLLMPMEALGFGIMDPAVKRQGFWRFVTKKYYKWESNIDSTSYILGVE